MERSARKEVLIEPGNPPLSPFAKGDDMGISIPASTRFAACWLCHRRFDVETMNRNGLEWECKGCTAETEAARTPPRLVTKKVERDEAGGASRHPTQDSALMTSLTFAVFWIGYIVGLFALVYWASGIKL